MTITHNLGFPRIGANRELKFALERYWRGDIDRERLLASGRELRAEHWRLQRAAGLDWLPVGDFAWYDHVLNTSLLFGAVPERHRYADAPARIDLDLAFRMGRGRAPSGADAAACGMIKWFDTNYHFIVPELHAGQAFSLHADDLLAQVDEAAALGHRVKPVLLGPLTWLWLGRADSGCDRLVLLEALLPLYRELLTQLAVRGASWVQIDEPILALDLPQDWQRAFVQAYPQLEVPGIKLLLASYFGSIEHQLDWLPALPVAGIHADLASAPAQLPALAAALDRSQVLSAGVIDGRNIWRADLDQWLRVLKPYRHSLGERLWLAPGCSLLHCPVDLAAETRLPVEVRARLAFAVQKLGEVAALARVVDGGDEGTLFAVSRRARQAAQECDWLHDAAVRARVAALTADAGDRTAPAPQRFALQQAQLGLPLFPTTTIGSFPQTGAIRRLRADHRSGAIDEMAYVSGIRAEIAHCIDQQEALGLDVLVHGEAERGDMVEYFGEQLDGFVFTENGWVQSYGSRCVKPPIIAGDVARPLPITVAWTRYAQSLSARHVKGMLTGPVTILKWSFVREDLPRAEVALQIALALRDEVADLERAGIRIIQLDEPAFREALPLRRADRDVYLDWAVRAFRVAAGGAAAATQIHSHMCYSEFDSVGEAIVALDVDVLTVETSRSDSAVLEVFAQRATPAAVGPGAYDIHSPLIPDADAIEARMLEALRWLPPQRLWVNPDCGLKTRHWPETLAALAAMVQAARRLRARAAAAPAISA